MDAHGRVALSATAVQRIGLALVAYGGVGILLVATALVGGWGGIARIDAALGSAAQASATIDAVADAFAGFDTSLEAAARSAEHAAVATRDASGTASRLADAMSLNIFGAQPLLPLANDFRRQSADLRAIAGDLEQLGGSLAKDRLEVGRIHDHVSALSARVGAFGAGTAPGRGSGVRLVALLAWIGAQAAGAGAPGSALLPPRAPFRRGWAHPVPAPRPAWASASSWSRSSPGSARRRRRRWRSASSCYAVARIVARSRPAASRNSTAPIARSAGSYHCGVPPPPRSMASWNRATPYVTGIAKARERTGSRNSSIGSTKPLKNIAARSTSIASWTAWRSESATSEMRRPSPSDAKVSSRMMRANPNRSPTNGTPSAPPSSATSDAAITSVSSPYARYLPTRSSTAWTGETRKRSIAPLVRSRIIESAVSVMARCWSTSASTAGAKNDMNDGRAAALFRVSSRSGEAMTSAGIRTPGEPTDTLSIPSELAADLSS